jgi:hypothetical protein
LHEFLAYSEREMKRRKQLVRGGLIVGIAALGFVGSSAAQPSRTLTVCPAGPPQCQFTSIQAALNAAENGDLILVARGKYAESITISKSVTLVGAGSNETAIVGRAEPRPVVSVTSGMTATISRVLVTRATSVYFHDPGIDNRGSLTVVDSVITRIIAGGIGRAGGIYNEGTLVLTRSTVRGNQGNVGGIYSAGGVLVLRNSAVVDNAGQFYGGIQSDHAATLIDSTIAGNSSSYDGGGITNYGGVLTVTRGSVLGNRAGDGTGGGIWTQGTTTVTDTIVDGNRADGGGGIFNHSGVLTVRGSVVNANVTEHGYQHGNGGGITNDGTARIYDSTISGNQGPARGQGRYSSGGAFDNHAAAELYRVTISGNDTSAQGGGIRNEGTMTLDDSKVTGNTARGLDGSGIFGGGVYNLGVLLLNRSTISGNTPDDCLGCPGGVRQALLPSLFAAR